MNLKLLIASLSFKPESASLLLNIRVFTLKYLHNIKASDSETCMNKYYEQKKNLYLVARSEIFCQWLPLLWVYNNAVVVVVADLPYQAGFLWQGQQTTLHCGHLKLFKWHKKYIKETMEGTVNFQEINVFFCLWIGQLAININKSM